ncbi:2-dehydropantoate 2-reductase [Vibrio galatheae]|uniref:2-dehydropantoate 2-reductase n=1 Tax=Vibrio galatheae TaxID=579748 RepID=A0A0F4NGM1_9VIBR|nr:2-dehydropantoate 2-reductase [Vibrio galatheae]KJY82265.1 2-dehydropantoate 2-reductase [Vibrio galatheae]
MNIAIVGPGAIGSLWAIKLKTAGHNVSLWSTSSEKILALQLGDQPAQQFSNRNLSEIKHADLILVTVKAWQVEQALSPLIAHIHHDTILVLMHNGMGTAESLQSLLPKNPLVLATTTHGAFKPSKQSVVHTGKGQTQLGGYNQSGSQCSFLESVFNHALPDTHWNPKIDHALWIKLAINCAINPLTAINQITNGQLTSQPYPAVISQVLDEVYLILRAEQIAISRDELGQTVDHVIAATAKNHSSMQQDIFHHRPSEIDFITGYLLQCAKSHGISLPKNLELYQAIKQIEQSWNL